MDSTMILMDLLHGCFGCCDKWLLIAMQDALPNYTRMATPRDPQENETTTGTYLGSGTHNAYIHDNIPRNLRQRNRNAIATVVQTQ